MSEPKARPPTPYERFVAATRQILSVSKAELQKRKAAYRKERARQRQRRKRGKL